jgi:glutamine amidotransferase-like uncharacterized protein
VAPGVDPEFKSQYCKQKKKKEFQARPCLKKKQKQNHKGQLGSEVNFTNQNLPNPHHTQQYSHTGQLSERS